MVTKKTDSKAITKKKVIKKKPIKKSVVKKTPVKKITKTVSKSVKTSKKNMAESPNKSMMSVLWFITTMIFAGAFLGILFVDLSGKEDVQFVTDQKIIRYGGQTFVSVKNLDEDFLVELKNTKTENGEFAVYDDKTWIPVPGKPIETIILTDSTCKSCDVMEPVKILRQNISPALMIRVVESNSPEGKDLITKFDITSIPQFIFDDTLATQKVADGKLLLEVSNGIFIKKDNQYLIDGTKVGFRVGKFLEAPKFADLNTEPIQGKGGKVRVVEFTDYQCPYCKRLHDNNKELIDQLVDEGKIEYVLKDFPLGFHKESMTAHKAANCVLKESGDKEYWEMNDKIFKNGPAWKGKGNKKANSYFISLAKDLDVDIADCLEDPTLNAEINAEINADIAEGRKYGVSGTPALFIGTEFMPGAIDAKTFEKAVNNALR
jgi:protein-disulfide isomerase